MSDRRIFLPINFAGEKQIIDEMFIQDIYLQKAACYL